jgi:hypothetical protein
LSLEEIQLKEKGVEMQAVIKLLISTVSHFC